jgi:hypothetical protein
MMQTILDIALVARLVVAFFTILIAGRQWKMEEILFTSLIPFIGVAIVYILHWTEVFPIPALYAALIAAEILFSFIHEKGGINKGSSFLLTLLLIVYLGNI